MNVTLFGRLTIHVCGPWDYGAPLRLHINWDHKPRDQFTEEEKYRGLQSGHWHLGIALTPSARFGRPLQCPGTPRWVYWSTPARTRKLRETYAAWKESHGN